MRRLPLGSGQRQTEPRRLVWQTIADLGDHCTAEEICERLQRGHPGFSRSTVYRALEAFTGSGALRVMRLGAGPARYEVSRDEHHHAICEVCNGILHVEDSLIHELEAHLADMHGFRPTRSEVLVIGTCAGCEGDRRQPGTTPANRNLGHVHQVRT